MTSQDFNLLGNKKHFQYRPINLEQLESRMMCTVNDLQACLELVDDPQSDSLNAPIVSSVGSNTPPSITRNVTATGVANGVVTSNRVVVSALGADDKGESRLRYNWTVEQAPAGGRVTFSRNGSNSAKLATFTFNKVGTYSVRLRITDADGASTTRLERFTVAPTVTRLILQSNGRGVTNNGNVIVTGASSSFTLRALDQFGSPITSALQPTWTRVSGPAGTQVQITATNGSTGTSTGDIGFTKAGSYTFDVAAGAVRTRFRVTVAPTLTSVAVTPGTADVEVGKQQQFRATGLDQFNQPMRTQPRFTWTATGGTIRTNGLFVAGNAAGSFTITARAGTLQTAATVNVTTPNNTVNPSLADNLQDAALRSLVQTFYADGSISRTDMIQLLRATGNDGSVNGTELADLRYIVSNATSFNMPDYVRNLAGDVVNGNPANAVYQGAAAGNLTAGSSATLLNNLVDKWFLGTDRPTLTSPSLSYRAASGTLFVGLPVYTDQRQGTLGDCYFIAALGSLATSNPTAIQNMFIDNGDGTYTVRFYGGTYGAFYNANGTISEGFANGVGVADYITVDRLLPSFSNGTFAYSNYGMSLSSPNNPLWIALAEKAYAQWTATGNSGRSGGNSYASIEGGWMSYVDAQVLGYNATRYSFATSANEQALLSALNSNFAVTAGTRSSGLTNGLVGSHAYTIRSYNATTRTYTLYNPWGTAQPTPLTWAQMQSNLTQFVVANPAGTRAFLATGVVNTITVRNQLEPVAMQATSTELVNLNGELNSHRELDVVEAPEEVSCQKELELAEHNSEQAVASPVAAVVQFSEAPDANAVDLLLDIDRLDALFANLLS